MPSLDNISLLIKTFERRESVERLLTSIRDHGYQSCPVFVADDSKEPYRDAILEKYGDIVNNYITLPFDVGVSRGRNELLSRVNTDYFVLNDDDFVFYEETNLLSALTTLNQHNFDILGGLLYELSDRPIFEFLPRRLSDFLGLKKKQWTEIQWLANISTLEDGGVAVNTINTNTEYIEQCDLVSNFFIARTESVRDGLGGWNPNIKTFGEHWEFFYRAKRHGLRVAASREWAALHVPASSETYAQYRKQREEQTMKKALRQAGVSYLQKDDDIFYLE